MGAEGFLKHFDQVRRGFSLAFGILFLYYLITAQYLAAGIILLILYAQVLYNQIYWKLKTIEAELVKNKLG